MLTRFQRAVMVAFFALFAGYFTHAGLLALILGVMLARQEDAAAIAAGVASSAFLYVGLLSLRSLRRTLHMPYI